MNLRIRILFVWAQAIVSTILLVRLISPPDLPRPVFALIAFMASLFMTRIQLIDAGLLKRGAFMTEPRWTRTLGWSCSFALFGGLIIMFLRDYSIGPGWLAQLEQIVFAAGALPIITLFVYEDQRLFRHKVPWERA